jgi:predicted transcriptional regulator
MSRARVKTKSEQEFDRTEILRYLAECGLQPVTPKSILIYLDDCLRPVSPLGVEFHLRYMRDRGWVELGLEKKVGEPEAIRWTRITAEGVDEYDRRCAALGEAR